tara:strand:- start:307 stop:567 length:261 start_codon:yes stop_codon:yes gene_type:complete
MVNNTLPIICLLVGIVAGWFFSDKYNDFMNFVEHDFEDLFKKNPHPELYDEDGNLHRGDYMVITFPPDYDPDKDEFYIDGPEDEEV